MNSSESYFNMIAEEYDYWKKKNHYYHQTLINLFRNLIPSSDSILEIGCGTGSILAELNPQEGRGIDISAEMITIAQRKYSRFLNLEFAREDIFDTDDQFNYQSIFLADVLEHVEDLPAFIKQLAKRAQSDSQIIISVANPIWEPLLMLAEKLKMKMPEGPHYRASERKIEQLFNQAGLIVVEKSYRLLIPKKIWGSDWVNQRFFRFALWRRLGFVIFWVLKKNYKVV